MAADFTFEKLLDFEQANRGLTAERRRQLEDAYYADKRALRTFINFRTKPDKLIWLEGQGISLDWAERDDISLPTPIKREDPR